jgi:phage shock protein PspC (stress-responsive transcriptional regulator)/predicted membrane protein
MDTNTEQTTTPPVDGSPRLERPRAGRVFAGVAAGLANRLDVPAWVVRLVLVVLAFAGGTGFALYVIGWLFIPNEGETESVAVRTFSRADGTRSWIGIGLIALAILIAVDSIGFVRGDFAFAVVLLIVGILLYRGNLRGLGNRDESEPVAGPVEPSVPIASVADPTLETSEAPSMTTQAPPAPPRPTRPAPPRRPKHPPSYLGRLTVGVGLVALGTMAFVDYLSTVFDPTARHYFGLAIATIGLALVAGGWFGRARGLIVLGVFLVPALLVSPVVEYGLEGGVGDRRISVPTASELDEPLELAIGQLVIDLRDLSLGGGQATLDARVGIGSLQIILPDGIAVTGEASVGIGEVRAFQTTRGGFARTSEFSLPGEGTLTIDARTNLGEVVISTSSAGSRSASVRSGDIELTVDDIAQLNDRYEYDAGDVVLDLSDLELTAIELPRTVSISMGTGNLTVLVDDRDLIDVNASVGIGRMELFGSESNGLGLDRDYDGDDAATLILDIEVGAGALTLED